MANRNDIPSYTFREIRGAVLNTHPGTGFPFGGRFAPEQLPQLRSAPHLQSFLQDMRAEAERASITPLAPLSWSVFHLFETTGERPPFEIPYYDRWRRLLGLVLTSVIDETDDYLETIHNVIWDICNEYTWSLNSHLPVGIEAVMTHRVPPEQVVDLMAAHTAHMLAETLVLLGDRLDPWLHYRIRTEIERRVFQPMFNDAVHFGWESSLNNWSAVCAGCVGMAALLLEDNRERLAGMIERVLRAMDVFLAGLGDDGGCAEGIGYWIYGFGFYTYFAEMLESFTGGALNLFDGAKIQRIAAFPMAVSFGNASYVNYSDAPEHMHVIPGMGSLLATRLGQPMPEMEAPIFHFDHCYRWGHIVRDLLWTNPALLHMPVADGRFFLSDLAWVVDRRVVNGVMVGFSAKGGHNDEPHNHNDLGHFLLHVGGDSLLADLGAGVYTRQYFGAERYTTLHPSSLSHSVPIIEGQPQQAGRTHEATVLAYEQSDDALRFTLDLTQAYDVANLEAFVRTFVWRVNPATSLAQLDLHDIFTFRTQPATLDECFISRTQPELGEGTARWHGAAGSVLLRFDKAQWDASVEPIATQRHDHTPETVYRLRLARQSPHIHEACHFSFACETNCDV